MVEGLDLGGDVNIYQLHIDGRSAREVNMYRICTCEM